MAPDVADAIEPKWEIEFIPDPDHLYMRVNQVHIRADGTIRPGAFQDHEGGMSTDWDKYASAEDTLKNARDPKVNAVVSMNVGEVRSIPGQSVQHMPLPENRAHTDVIGDKGGKNSEVRVKFTDICRIVI